MNCKCITNYQKLKAQNLHQIISPISYKEFYFLFNNLIDLSRVKEP
jgi:hypothetical protein